MSKNLETPSSVKTERACFMCLKNYSYFTKPSLKRRSIRAFCRHLRIKFENKSDHNRVYLCSGCSQINYNFTKSYRELQFAKNKFDSTVKKIHSSIVKADNLVCQNQKFQEISLPKNEVQLRETIMNKCFSKVEIAMSEKRVLLKNATSSRAEKQDYGYEYDGGIDCCDDEILPIGDNTEGGESVHDFETLQIATDETKCTGDKIICGGNPGLVMILHDDAMSENDNFYCDGPRTATLIARGSNVTSVFIPSSTKESWSVIHFEFEFWKPRIYMDKKMYWSTPIFPEFTQIEGDSRYPKPLRSKIQLRPSYVEKTFSKIRKVRWKQLQRNVEKFHRDLIMRRKNNVDVKVLDSNVLGEISDTPAECESNFMITAQPQQLPIDCQEENSNMTCEYRNGYDHNYDIVSTPITTTELKESISNDLYIQQRWVRGVFLIHGEIYRTAECKFCQESAPKYNGNMFYCSECMEIGSSEAVMEKVMTIFEITLMDRTGVEVKNMVCFNDAAVELLGKKGDEYRYDEEVETDLKNIMGAELNVQVSYNPRHKMVVINHIEVISQSLNPENEDQYTVTEISRPVSAYNSIKVVISDDVNFEIEDPQVDLLKTLPEKREYDMKSAPSGYALILNVVRYDDPKKERSGADMDFLKLFRLFRKLNFKIYGNDFSKPLYYSELSTLIEKFKKDLVENNISSFVIIVMGHGCDNYFLELSDGDIISIDGEIIEPFSTKKCPKFAEKPKIFIFNMCRTFLGHDIECGDTRSPDIIHAYQCHATSRGHEAIRNGNGSFFIDRLVKEFRSYTRSMHLKELFERVAFVMEKDLQPYENQYLAPCEHRSSIFGNFFFKVEEANCPSDLDEVYEREMRLHLERKKANFRFALDS